MPQRPSKGRCHFTLLPILPATLSHESDPSHKGAWVRMPFDPDPEGCIFLTLLAK